MKWNYPYNLIFFAGTMLAGRCANAQLTSLDGGSAQDIAQWSKETATEGGKVGKWEGGKVGRIVPSEPKASAESDGVLGAKFYDLGDKPRADVAKMEEAQSEIGQRPNTSHLKPKTADADSPARWWRVRSHFDPAVSLPEKVQAEVKALGVIQSHGINPVIFARWSSNSWKSGVRAGRVQGFPLDLREAFERGRGYGRAYGEVAAAFEIENEPDIDYVNENPETYLAFHKAMYLGVHQGAAEAAVAAKMEDGRSEIGAESEAEEAAGKDVLGFKGYVLGSDNAIKAQTGESDSGLKTSNLKPKTSPPLVVMAPLALPPGPYFERLVENGLLSYTDAFNYHYYGYAEDFTGVYEQFRAAVTAAGTAKMGDGRWEIGQEAALGGGGEKVGKWESEKVGIDLRGGPGLAAVDETKDVLGFRSYVLGTENVTKARTGENDSGLNTSHLKPKTPATTLRRLPVLITEYGYGSLLGDDRDTVEGRVRQWRWFKTVAPQIRHLRIAGPMAFYVPPYFEGGAVEFGLTMKAVPSTAKIEDGGSKIGDGLKVGPDLRSGPGLKVGRTVPGEPGSVAANAAKIENRKSTIGAEEDALGADSGKVQKGESLNAELVGKVEPATAPSHFATFTPLTSATFSAGGLTFTPADFGDSRTRLWMKGIGNKIGNNEQSPALAWLLDYGEKHPYRPRDWTIQAPAPSPVVIDFIAGKNLNQLKRYGGYLAMNDAHGVPQVEGELVVYNFSNRPVNGRLEKVEKWKSGKVGPDRRSGPGLKVGRTVPGETESSAEGEDVLGFKFYDLRSDGENAAAAAKMEDRRSVIGVDLIDPNTSHLKPKTSPPGAAITLAPNERRVIRVSFSLSNNAFKAHTVKWSFVPDEIEEPTSVFSTQFYPESAGMGEKVLVTFDHASAAATGNRILLEKRKSAREETPFYRTEGRWRVTSGVQVNESTQSVWRFKVERAPSLSYGTSSAELPLPDDFIFPDHGVFSFSYRLVSHRNGSPASLPFDTYFRTANGNLYQVWPRSYAQSAWNTYMELKENFTMAFYNRSVLPWRFEDNRPVALVFRFRPGAHIPATFEIANPRIGLLERK